MADTWGWKGVIAIRILQGMFQGFFFPSVHNIIGKWAPKEERSTIGNFVFTGKFQCGKLKKYFFGICNPITNIQAFEK